jgi:hypothetical protein
VCVCLQRQELANESTNNPTKTHVFPSWCTTHTHSHTHIATTTIMKKSLTSVCVAALLCVLVAAAVANNDFDTLPSSPPTPQRMSPFQRINSLLYSPMNQKAVRADNTCTKYSCTGMGSSCDGDMLTNRETCKNWFVCLFVFCSTPAVLCVCQSLLFPQCCAGRVFMCVAGLVCRV